MRRNETVSESLEKWFATYRPKITKSSTLYWFEPSDGENEESDEYDFGSPMLPKSFVYQFRRPHRVQYHQGQHSRQRHGRLRSRSE